MSDQLFQIIFRGKLLTGFTLEQARANLAQLFRTDEARIGTMLAQPKWVIKAGVAKETAQKIQEAMRNAGLMVAIMADESASAVANVAAAPTNAATATTPPPAVAPTPVVAAPAAQAATVKIAPITPVDAAIDSPVIDTPSADAPLAVKAKVAAFDPDLSSFSLADVGAVMDASGPKKAERSFALEQFSLANVGAQLIEKKPVVAKTIDTGGLSLVAADIPKEPKLTALHREFEG